MGYDVMCGRWRQAVVLMAVVVCAAFIGMGLYFNVGGHVAPPYADTSIYMQYARAIGEGHPYRFCEWDRPTTGSTSHLYPWVLSVPYMLGMKGDALVTAAALMGCASFLLFLLIYMRIGRLLAPRSLPLGALLTVFSGHVVMGFLGQNDMLLFMLLVALGVMAYLERRTWLLCLVLPLLPLTRPDGVLLVATFIGAEGVRIALARDWHGLTRWGSASLFGLLGIGAMYGVNVIATGHASFDSVLGKGHVAVYPFAGAVVQSLQDLMDTLRQLVLGLSDGNRGLLLFPMLGGGLVLVGVLTRRWSAGDQSVVWSWLLVAGLLQMGLVATSGWSGIHYDRYFAWLFPFLYLLLAAGARRLCQLVAPRSRRAYLLLGAVLLAYQCAALTMVWGRFGEQCRNVRGLVNFVRDADRQLPPRASLGFCGQGGLLYYMPSRRGENLYGVLSSRFVADIRPEQRLELLKHRTELRPDYLLMRPELATVWEPITGGVAMESVTALGSDMHVQIYRADWRALDRAVGGPVSTNLLAQLAGQMCVGSLDVGYADDELARGYEQYLRVPGVRTVPVVTVAVPVDGGTNRLLEVGRAVIGYESFHVPTRAGQPLTLVLRTGQSMALTVATCNAALRTRRLVLDPAPMLRIIVGDQVFDQQLDLADAGDGMVEVLLYIPATAITGSDTVVTIGGDHVSYAYWFYQPAE